MNNLSEIRMPRLSDKIDAERKVVESKKEVKVKEVKIKVKKK